MLAGIDRRHDIHNLDSPGLELPGLGCQTGGISEASVNTASDSFNEIATVRIELRHTDPLIWRQVEVPTSITLRVLHDVIQAIMGWFDYHLWEFSIDRRKYGLAMDEDWRGAPRSLATHVRLRDVLKPAGPSSTTPMILETAGSIGLPSPMFAPASQGSHIRATLAAKETGRPRTAAASRASTNGLKHVRPHHEGHTEAKEWADEYDPDAVDELPIKHALSRIANRRNAAKARIAKIL